MSDSLDQILRFTFANHDVRGEIVQLQESYHALTQGHAYPAPVKQLLGELMAVTSLLTATLKFEGHINVQIQGDGPLNYATVNGSHEQALRGVARLTSEPTGTSFRELVGDNAILLITLTPEHGERYQGVTTIAGDSLAACIEEYFSQSEQLATRVWLFADIEQERAGGLFLQALPGSNGHEGFEHLTTLASTVTAEELLQLPATDMLQRLYHEEEVHLYPTQAVRFFCGCSKEATATALRSVPQDELMDILAQEGELKLTCDYCLTDYHFNAFDVQSLHAHQAPEQPQ
ncbi:Hsp33 family molecular chaperone HslO [Aliidiomarina halalkaliphila]|uniref:33 kDa chaperonin n=1 Tax=Aliidiomarina halalkaliphila TaxID=2593535 RepID=A0A552X5T3_9GAMM|nr:Hsp33 family molecular chaperone HslO [Aliidiomarina halalkaliphila]TRW50319.1 Hsp33 family molecular chaperone HslO [Aliidiomarina halalkaliphila]